MLCQQSALPVNATVQRLLLAMQYAHHEKNAAGVHAWPVRAGVVSRGGDESLLGSIGGFRRQVHVVNSPNQCTGLHMRAHAHVYMPGAPHHVAQRHSRALAPACHSPMQFAKCMQAICGSALIKPPTSSSSWPQALLGLHTHALLFRRSHTHPHCERPCRFTAKKYPAIHHLFADFFAFQVLVLTVHIIVCSLHLCYLAGDAAPRILPRSAITQIPCAPLLALHTRWQLLHPWLTHKQVLL